MLDSNRITRVFSSEYSGNEGSDDDDDALSTTNNDNGVQEAKSPHLSNPDFLKISPHESGIAVYMDLHGHASKKGCETLTESRCNTSSLSFIDRLFYIRQSLAR